MTDNDGVEFDQIREALIARRRALGMNQREVAVRMKTHHSTVNYFENGRRASYSILRRYAVAVYCDLKFSAELTYELSDLPPQTFDLTPAISTKEDA